MKRVVVTGASSGIGRELALLLAEEGHALVLIARRQALLEELAGECRSRGAGAAVVLPADLADPDPVAPLGWTLEQLEGEEVALVCNAGTARFEPLSALNRDSFRQHMDVIFFGAVACLQAVLPLMLREGRGQIVNVVSMIADHPFPNSAAYGAAKAAQLYLGKVAALELRRKGIRVTNVLPGATDTPIWEAVGASPPKQDMMPARAVAEEIARILAMPPDRVVDEITLMPPKGIL